MPGQRAQLPAAGRRSEAGYRVYGPGALGRLAFTRRTQALGFSAMEIRRLVEGPHAGSEAELAKLRRVVAHKLAEVERRVQELTGLRTDREAMYARLLRAPGLADCGHVGDCACWLPTEEEVRAMATDVQSARDCCCCDCPDCRDDCGCCSTSG